MNAKQTVFVNEYLKCWNASEAARRAGYNGHSEVTGCRLLKDANIAAEIKARVSELTMTADECLVRLADHARGSLADFIDGNAISLERAREAGRLHLLKSYSEAGEKTGARIEIYDAQAALEKIGKAHGLFTDKLDIEVGVKDNLRDKLADKINRISTTDETDSTSSEPKQ